MDDIFLENVKIHQALFEADFLQKHVEFESCTFDGIVFETINLSHYKFIDCEFIHCNLSNCNLKKIQCLEI